MSPSDPGSPLEVIVLGARGRMGQMVLQACAPLLRQNPPRLRIKGAVERPDSPHLGQPAGVEGVDVAVTGDLQSLLAPGVVLIDFTSPKSTLAALAAVRGKGCGMVICTTGFSPAEKQAIAEAAASMPIVMAPNMSMGVTVMFRVAEMVAKALADFDVEIVEAHHSRKQDAPSGTALGFAEAVARGRKVDLASQAVYGRRGITGERPPGQIGIHAVRGGDIVGDHTVLFAGDGERVELKHVAHSRQTFAQGAVKAALFLRGRSPGLYDMFDVLGL